MAIELVGSKALSWAQDANVSFDFTGLSGGLATSPSVGDFIIIAASAAAANTSAALAALDLSTVPVGFSGTPDASVTGPDTCASGMKLWHGVYEAGSSTGGQFFGATSGGASRARTATIFVVRGVSTFDVSIVTANGIEGPHANPPAITPSTAGSWIMVIGAAAHQAGTTNFTDPADLTDIRKIAHNVGIGDFDGSILAGLKKDWVSGAFDPAVFTGLPSNGLYSWTAMSLALRLETPPTADGAGGSTGSSSAAAVGSSTAGAGGIGSGVAAATGAGSSVAAVEGLASGVSSAEAVYAADVTSAAAGQATAAGSAAAVGFRFATISAVGSAAASSQADASTFAEGVISATKASAIATSGGAGVGGALRPSFGAVEAVSVSSACGSRLLSSVATAAGFGYSQGVAASVAVTLGVVEAAAASSGAGDARVAAEGLSEAATTSSGAAEVVAATTGSAVAAGTADAGGSATTSAAAASNALSVVGGLAGAVAAAFGQASADSGGEATATGIASGVASSTISGVGAGVGSAHVQVRAISYSSSTSSAVGERLGHFADASRVLTIGAYNRQVQVLTTTLDARTLAVAARDKVVVVSPLNPSAPVA